VGDFEFDTSNMDTNQTNGEYMISGFNMELRKEYHKARTNRVTRELGLVHRDLHPLFHKNPEELRNYDIKMANQLGQQKRRESEGNGSNRGETDGESDESSTEVLVVNRSSRKRRFKIYTKENTGKKKYGGWSEEGIDRMETLMTEISVDRGDVPGDGASGALKNAYWNFENAYYEWEDETLGAYNSNRKRRGRKDDVKERTDSAIASVEAYKLKLQRKRQRNK
jgi:hypothetical protein